MTMIFSEIVEGNCVQYGDRQFVATTAAQNEYVVYFVDGFIVDGDFITNTRWFSNGDDVVQLIIEKYELI
ncbi:hypothetical protein RAG47_14510 [Klebsiella pneumoniae]|uniref:hypothetical protein n=1 Tax=Klebsiella variicola TaxID=244366 RepID=UPI0020735A43|nr:hypothetical protein [Klebsiella pneumoniae]HCO1390244.1 hypothetical protein [Escherichia coli]